MKGAERLVMIQVSDVLADESLAVHNQCDCVFQVGAHRQNRTLGRKRRHGTGSIAP